VLRQYVELPLRAPNWVYGVNRCLFRKKVSLSAMIFSRTLPMHSSSCMSR
jgi:hypothetical protein